MSKKFSYYNSVVPAYLTAANAYITAANFTNPDVKTVIIDLFEAVYNNGYENKIAFLYLDTTDLTGSPSFASKWAQMKWNAWNPVNSDAAYRQTVINTPTLDMTGITFNGSNNYIDTNFVPSADSILGLNSAAYSVYCNSVVTTDFEAEMGCIDGSNNSVVIATRYTGTQTISSINDARTTPSLSSASNKQYTQIRTTSSVIKHRTNGTQVVNDSSHSSTAKPTNSIYRGGLHLGPDAVVLSTKKQCCAWGANFTEAEAIIFDGLINTYNADLETALGLSANSRHQY
jgi:hypothetical protein